MRVRVGKMYRPNVVVQRRWLHYVLEELALSPLQHKNIINAKAAAVTRPTINHVHEEDFVPDFCVNKTFLILGSGGAILSGGGGGFASAFCVCLDAIFVTLLNIGVGR